MFRVFVPESRRPAPAHGSASTSPSPLDRLTPYRDDLRTRLSSEESVDGASGTLDDPRRPSVTTRRLWAALRDRSRAGALAVGLIAAALLPGLSPTAVHAAGTLTPIG